MLYALWRGDDEDNNNNAAYGKFEFIYSEWKDDNDYELPNCDIIEFLTDNDFAELTLNPTAIIACMA